MSAMTPAVGSARMAMKNWAFDETWFNQRMVRMHINDLPIKESDAA
jgi:nuclear transport factor 2 (NTF2) superfamily protein